MFLELGAHNHGYIPVKECNFTTFTNWLNFIFSINTRDLKWHNLTQQRAKETPFTFREVQSLCGTYLSKYSNSQLFLSPIVVISCYRMFFQLKLAFGLRLPLVAQATSRKVISRSSSTLFS